MDVKWKVQKFWRRWCLAPSVAGACLIQKHAFSLDGLNHAEFGRSLSNAIRGVADPTNTLLPTCYQTKLGRSVLYGRMGVDRVPKIGGRWDPDPWAGAWLTPRNMFLQHLCYHAKFGYSRSNCKSVIMEIRQKKNWPLMPRLSRSLKVIGTDTDRSTTYDFLSVIHCNRGPIWYRFWDKRRCLLKIANFSTPHVFNAPRRRSSPWNIVRVLALWKLGSCPYHKMESVCWYVQLLRYNSKMWRTVRKTDRCAKTILRSACIACWCAW